MTKYKAASPERLRLVSIVLMKVSMDSQGMTSSRDWKCRLRDPKENDTLFRGTERPSLWSSLDLMRPYMSDKIDVLLD